MLLQLAEEKRRDNNSELELDLPGELECCMLLKSCIDVATAGQSTKQYLAITMLKGTSNDLAILCVAHCLCRSI